MRYISEKSVDIIMRHTNKKAIATYATYDEKNPTKPQLKWKDVIVPIMCSGADHSNNDNAKDLWAITTFSLYRATINRFWAYVLYGLATQTPEAKEH